MALERRPSVVCRQFLTPRDAIDECARSLDEVQVMLRMLNLHL